MQKTVRIAFFGTPTFASRVLERIVENDAPVEVAFVVTQPDKPAGRKQILTPSPVKMYAIKNGIAYYESHNALEVIEKLKQTDLVLLFAYGSILSQELLSLPKYGFWNIHPSLLPKYRGTSPIAYALLMGEGHTGVTLMEMDDKMDHGPLIEQEKYEIVPSDTRETLENRLSDIGYELFNKNVQLLINGKLQKHEQNHLNRTFTRLLAKKDGFIPFAVFKKIIAGEDLAKEDCPSLIAEYHTKYGVPPYFDFRLSVFHLFQGLTPWPGVWTLLRLKATEGQALLGKRSDGQAPQEKRVKITGMEIHDGKPVITRVQLEGKKEVSLPTFQAAYSI